MTYNVITLCQWFIILNKTIEEKQRKAINYFLCMGTSLDLTRNNVGKQCNHYKRQHLNKLEQLKLVMLCRRTLFLSVMSYCSNVVAEVEFTHAHLTHRGVQEVRGAGRGLQSGRRWLG